MVIKTNKMTANEVRAMMPKKEFRDEINNFTIEQIVERIHEYALENKYQTSFYGDCNDARKLELNMLGYGVECYNFPPKEPMTAIFWDNI